MNSAACPVWIAARWIEDGKSSGTGGVHFQRVNLCQKATVRCTNLCGSCKDIMVKHFISQNPEKKIAAALKEKTRKDMLFLVFNVGTAS